MARLALALLGGFDLRADGAPADLPGAKERALLAILAVDIGASLPRERLAGLLWGERGEAQARDSLKHALARLRATIGDAIETDRQAARLDPDAIEVDVASFLALLAEGTAESEARALRLYRGDLLDGLAVRDAGFADWLEVERARLRSRAEEAAGRRLAEGGADAALRLHALDPLREDAVRALMRHRAGRGEHAQALKLYTGLRDRLHRELGVRPEPETAALAEAIRSGREAVAEPPAGPPLPDRPSIAVLAFQNLSGDPEQEYFADGIVEEIIGALSRLRWLFVIARNSSFVYKGRAVDVKQVARELGVRYLLEGSVRAAASRVRIAARLIDATSGSHLWAESFDGELADIFALQDQVTARVVGAIAPKLEAAEIERTRQKPTNSLDAYDYFLRGVAALHRWKREANDEAVAMFAGAVARDPDFAAAYGLGARCLSQRKACGWVKDAAADAAEVRRLARQAVETGFDDAVALSAAGIAVAFVANEVEEGSALIERALDLNPNLAVAWLYIGWVEVWRGEPGRALAALDRAIRLSPHDPQSAMMAGASACAHFFAGRFAEAALLAERSVGIQPDYRIAACVLAASRALGGKPKAARAAMDRVRAIDPALRVSNLLATFPIRRPEHAALWAEGLRLAGLPE